MQFLLSLVFWTLFLLTAETEFSPSHMRFSNRFTLWITFEVVCHKYLAHSLFKVSASYSKMVVCAALSENTKTGQLTYAGETQRTARRGSVKEEEDVCTDF